MNFILLNFIILYFFFQCSNIFINAVSEFFQVGQVTELTNEIMYKLLKAIEKDPKTNQRQLSAELNVCLGRINLFINELLEKGLITTEKTPKNNSQSLPISPDSSRHYRKNSRSQTLPNRPERTQNQH